jgi:hypothetical protein
MQKISFIILILISQLTFFDCKSQPSISKGIYPFKIELEKSKQSIDLRLSDLIDSCMFVPLETTNESILESYFNYVYVSKNFIIIVDRNGVYKFASNGKFIKKIINVGRGPQELSVAPRFCYYEKKNILFIEDYYGHKDHILRYDVKSETFLPPIKKCFPGQWNNFTIYNDTLIMGSLSIYVSDTSPNPYAIFFQNFKGEFISGLKSKREFVHFKEQNRTLQRMIIYTGANEIHVKYAFDDTIFSMKDNRLFPYLISTYSTPRNEPPIFTPIPIIGAKQSYYERYVNPNYLIFRNKTYEGLVPFKPGADKAKYKTVYYFLDKSTGKSATIKTYTDDISGKIQTSDDETITFPSSLPNDLIYTLYYPNDLLQKAPSDLTNKGFLEKVNSQLSKIKSSINETDNPILLIGKPKRKILILK